VFLANPASRLMIFAVKTISFTKKTSCFKQVNGLFCFPWNPMGRVMNVGAGQRNLRE
jgi:hypothetical protein